MDIRSKRLTLVDNEDFELVCEYTDRFFILHLPRLASKPGAVKHLKAKLDELCEFVDTSSWQMLFAAIPSENKKMHKLLKILKATYRGTSQGFDVYSWEKEI